MLGWNVRVGEKRSVSNRSGCPATGPDQHSQAEYKGRKNEGGAPENDLTLFLGELDAVAVL